MTVEIVHPVPVDDVAAWTKTMAVTFLENPAGDQHKNWIKSLQRDWLPDRFWGARDRGSWVGTLGSWPFQLTVPGGDATVSADGLTMVTVAGTHRRRGLLTTMLTDSLHAARDRGDAVSILWAAEWPIYWRFGYAPATTTAYYVLHPRSPGGSLPVSGDGTLRQVESAELAALAPELFARAVRGRPGNIDRSPAWWLRQLGLDGYPDNPHDGKARNHILYEGPDGVDGFITWVPGPPDPETQDPSIEVLDLCAATDSAYRHLWAYVSSLDLVDRIKLHRRPIDEPVRWLLPDGRALHLDWAGDGLWLRLLDVPTALSARRYQVADRLVLEVVDDDAGGFAAGRYVLDGGPDGANCQASTVDTPDLRVHQRALAMAYLGGTSLHSQLIAGRVEELTTGALRRADAMFLTPTAPWCATGF
jgi:predicted acetyltransferase